MGQHGQKHCRSLTLTELPANFLIPSTAMAWAQERLSVFRGTPPSLWGAAASQLQGRGFFSAASTWQSVALPFIDAVSRNQSAAEPPLLFWTNTKDLIHTKKFVFLLLGSLSPKYVLFASWRIKHPKSLFGARRLPCEALGGPLSPRPAPRVDPPVR